MSVVSNPYLFVVGCPRSGTTLLQRMLNAHPDLAVTNDTHFITRSVKRMSIGPDTALNGKILECVRGYRRFHRLGVPDEEVEEAAAESSTYAEFVSALYDRVATKEGKPLAGEKTPDYCRSLPFLAELFPWAHFIHIIRDGRDVALSTLEWARGRKGPSRWETWKDSPVGTCALWWAWQAGTGIRDGGTLRNRYQEVRYADLVEDPEQTMRRVLDGVGLEYRAEVLEFARGRTKSDPSLSAKSAWLPPTPGLRDWRAQMEDDDIELFECLAGDLLTNMGFERRFLSFRPETERKAANLQSRFEGWQSSRHPIRAQRPALVIPPSSRLDKPIALSVHDERVIARDKTVRGLPDVLDGNRLLERISPLLTTNIDRISPTYVRYKPQTNCLVGYEAGTGDETLWLYAKAHADHELEKLHKAASKAAEPTRNGPSTIVFEDIGVVVRLFPLDAKLPALWRFQHDPSGKIIDRLFDDSHRLDDVRFEPIRWKPERRLVMRMSVRGKDYAAVKFMTYGSFNRVWSLVRHRGTLGHVRTPRFIGHSKRLRSIAYEWLEGRVLADTIRETGFEPRRLEAVAAVLAEVHRGSPRNMPTILPGQTISELEASASTVKALAPELAPKLDRILSNIAESITSGPVELTFIHGDFYAKQILVHGNEVALLDFDGAAIGNRHLDLGNFVAHLHRDRVRGRLTKGQATETESQFLGSYRSIHPSVAERELAAYIAAGLVKLAPHPFRFREEDWFEQTKAILDIADSYTQAGTFFESREIPKPITNGADHRRIDPDHRFVLEGLNPATMEKRLDELLRGSSERSGRRLVGMKLVRQKPGRRSLIEYTLRNPEDRSETKSLLGKIRNKGLDRRTFELTRTLFETSFGPDAADGIRVPEPLGCLPELNMWLQERVSAASVTSHLSTDANAAFGERVARALHKLHRQGPRVGRVHRISEELGTLEKGFWKVSRERPQWSIRLQYLLDRLRILAESLDDFPDTPLHRDFYPDQVLLDDENTYLIDLDLYAMGDPALDVGNFIAHLWEMALRTTGDCRAFDREAETLRETYLGLSHLPLDHNIHVYTWLSMARHIVISNRIPERKDGTERILKICESFRVDQSPRRLAGGAWSSELN